MGKIARVRHDWLPISIAPTDCDLLLCVIDEQGPHALVFPCRKDGRYWIIVDPPYTVKHNNNGFLKYNETIFSWNDQVRLAASIRKRAASGANFLMTNAYHDSLIDLYKDFAGIFRINRATVISGKSVGRGRIDEALIVVGPHWRKFDWSSYSSYTGSKVRSVSHSVA